MDLFSRSWSALRAAVEEVSGAQWIRPSGCTGWLVQDLVFHLIIDAQDLLITLATPSTAEPAIDAVSYWQLDENAPDGTDPHSEFVRRSANAYGSTDGEYGVKYHFNDLAGAAARVAGTADPADRVETRGQTLTVADYLGAYVVEATLHHLDLVAHLPEIPAPPAEGLATTRHVLEKLAGTTIPASFTDRDAVLVATGRRAPTEAETAALGDLALPLVLG